jgi:WD40 repeat protein
MAQPDVWWYGSPGFIAIFDVKERTYHNFGAVAGLPDQFNSDYPYYSISPNRDYMFMFAPTFPQVYLIDLATFKSEPYDTELAEWSTNGKYALIGDQVLTLSDKTLRSLPAIPDFEKFSYWIIDAWHPTAGARLIIYADKQKHQFLYLLDIETLTYRHLALPSNFDDSRDTSITWSPNGDRFVLAAADGSLWQMDYPKLENLQQLTPPIADVKDISWSPDGRYLSYVGGADIYIMDVESNP